MGIKPVVGAVLNRDLPRATEMRKSMMTEEGDEFAAQVTLPPLPLSPFLPSLSVSDSLSDSVPFSAAQATEAAIVGPLEENLAFVLLVNCKRSQTFEDWRALIYWNPSLNRTVR